MFLSAALASTSDAFSLGAAGPMQRQQKPLFGFASDRGESTSQFEHFSISTDPSDPIAPPPMARPSENSQLAMVDKTSSAPPAAVQGDGQPAERKLSVWERTKAAEVQGGSLRTWSFQNQHKMDMVQVHMKTDGRPMNANGKHLQCVGASILSCNSIIPLSAQCSYSNAIYSSHTSSKLLFCCDWNMYNEY